ncbi:ABC transporter ATP-binding protein [Leptolyngbya sp. PCC 6406]|uniref:ABC transporter ATP-binding protein n=1 Tax=Leptolyngbya sp. PCC 6406 TaxID=1173264 RepID=UPI0002ABDC85|nr:ABC transporter ATP-binding protein [Leptolyngbya sp. PCC 6406]
MAGVRLEQITQRFGTTVAVQGVTFAVPDGEFWVLVGPSGCGKSTLLRAIAGLESVTEGDLYIGDRRVNDLPARQRDVAMVFQNYALYPHMTVAQNLAFGLRMRQVPATERESQVLQVARSLDIDHLLNRKPGQLSGGQQQRVALGRAIARRPQVFLLDEPLSNLDAQLRDGTRAELKQLHQKFGITTLYVTHDQVEAMTLSDRVVMLDQGQVQQIGTPQDLYSRPANRRVAAFLGSPPMNVLTAIFDGTGFWINGQPLAMPAHLPQAVSLSSNQVVSLGIRPEQVSLAFGDEMALTVTVQVVEPLGRETLIRGIIPAQNDSQSPQSLAVLMLPHSRPIPGESLRIRIDPNHLFLFDLGSGTTLYPPEKMD